MRDAEPTLAKTDNRLRTCTGWSIFFMVLLRVAIGWHFFYEGAWKLKQDDWRATSYLVMSMGPLRPLFSGHVSLPVIGPMVKDVDGIEQLTTKGTQQRMDDRCEKLLAHYNITDATMADQIKAYKDAHNGPAEKAPEFAGVVGGSSSRLADAVYADFMASREDAAAASQPAPGFAEKDVKASIEAMLANRVEGFVPRKLEGADSEGLSAALANLLNSSLYQSRFALLKQGFANDLRNFRMGYVESIFDDADTAKQIDDYKTLLDELQVFENNLGSTAYNKERLLDQYGRKAKAKAACIARAEKPLTDLDNFVLAQLTKAYSDAKTAGDAKADDIARLQLSKALPHYPSPTWFIDWSNMLALTAVGVGLMLGLFTRLSAVGGIGLLMLYYWCMPSFPWLPEAGPMEGHYLIINKNIIEALALAMIATSGVGRWGGLDGLLFRKRRIQKASQV